VWKKSRVFYRLFRRTRCTEPGQAIVHIDATIRLAKRGRQNFEGGEV
jgi:hypothetical protein